MADQTLSFGAIHHTCAGSPPPPIRYLPGAQLPHNIVAVPDLETAVDGADILIICAPHQFVRGICKQLQASGKVRGAWGVGRGVE